jgi:hypothetical protein
MDQTNPPAKDPQDWKSGDDPATPAQESYLNTLADQTGEDIPDDLTKAAASEKIDELRGKAGLGGERVENETVGDDDPYIATPVSPNANR